MMPVFAEVRLGKWQEILDRPAPDRRWLYASLLSDFARGLAFVRLGRPDSARGRLENLRLKLKEPMLAIRQRPWNAPVKGATVAEGILAGELAFAEGRREEAMAAFDRAIACEDSMTYTEPNDWVLSARHFAGVCLLRMNRGADAEKMYRDDLAENPGNGWALVGLAQSLEIQHKEAPGIYREMARKAFAGAEAIPTASAY
jgi:tetratricopeptide (TPR) repeat protein